MVDGFIELNEKRLLINDLMRTESQEDNCLEFPEFYRVASGNALKRLRVIDLRS